MYMTPTKNPLHIMKTSMDRNNSSSPRMGERFLVPSRAFRIIISVVLLLQSMVVAGQSSTITGRIVDEKGEPVPGVNVVVKGTSTGTGTDLQGRYMVSVNNATNPVLVISVVGFESQEITIGTRSIIDVQLNPNLTQLDELVVTGYSTMAKKDLSSSIAVVDVDDMKKIAASNFADQLQGKVAGVQIATSNDPGSFQYVRVRGIGTINNNEPLYVIDGVPVQNETNMNFLNPNDIESLQVLKDAAAASIYGARAANGVVVITTKRGTGRSKFNFDFFTGMQYPQKFPELATPSELLEIQKGLAQGAGVPFNSTFYLKDPNNSDNWVLPDFLINTNGYAAGDPKVDPSAYVLNTTDPDLFDENNPITAANKTGTNWFNELFKPAPLTSVQLSASGGTEKGSHYFSLSYYDYKGILIKNGWQRVQARMNSTFAAGKNFRVGENLNVSFQKEKGRDRDQITNVMNAYTYLSIVPVSDINGYWAAASHSSTAGPNPVAAQTRNSDGKDYNNVRIMGNVFAELDFLEAFRFRVNAGLDYFQFPYEKYYYSCPECGKFSTNALEKGSASDNSWVLSGTLNYNKTINRHTIYALGGGEMRSAYHEFFYASGSNLKYGDDPYYRELTNVQSSTYLMGSETRDSKMVSLFANVNYTYDDRYVFSGTVRSDGSSKFLNNTYGLFYGGSAAWLISQEQFFNDSKFITDLKLRASYGVTGNNEVVGGDYPGFTSYGTSTALSSYSLDGEVTQVKQGFRRISSGNENLQWETSHLLNLAFDAKVSNNLDVTVEWYSRKTKGMILGVPQPLESGNTFPINENIGSMINRGVDVQLSYHGKSPSKNLYYDIGLTGTHYKNEVLSLDSGNAFINGASLHGGYPSLSRTSAGQPVSQFFGYVSEGIWQSQQEIDSILFANPGQAKPGRMRFADIDKDGRITDKDRTFIGNPIPKFILGLNLTLRYKNFDFTAYFSGVFGQDVFNAVKANTDFNNTNVLLSGSVNRSKKMLYESGKTLPVLDVNDSYSGQVSSYFVEDASFLRCRNVVLGYTIPQRISSKAGLVKSRIYFQVQNLFLITDYSGLDPDVTVFNMIQGNWPQRDLTTGLDIGRYPWSRQFMIGLNIEF